LPEEIWFYLAIIFGITTIASIVLFLIEREKKRYPEGETKRGEGATAEKFLPVERSVPEEVVKGIRNKLRVLDVEREILSYAIRKLYEAQAEGKITPEERDSLAKKYSEELERVKEEIARGETIIALNELERMREEFIKMFSERLEIIDKRIEELKAIAGIKPIEQAAKPVEETKEQVPTQKEQVERQPIQAVQRRRKETVKPRASEEAEERVEEKKEETVRGEADKSIEKIVTEIERVLSRLSQIEAEE